MSTLYSFTFTYQDGSFYIGTVIDDGFFGYTVGEQIATPFGAYSINANLGVAGGPVGGIKISQYHDAFNGQNFIPTSYTSGQYDGFDLGTEYDDIRDANGGLIDTIGHGGLNEVGPVGGFSGHEIPFSFSFTYNDGSSYTGTVYDNGDFGYHAGELIPTTSGVYRVTAFNGTPTVIGPNPPANGEVIFDTYTDASSGRTFQLPANTPGSGGLGAEELSVPSSRGALLFGGGQFLGDDRKFEATQVVTRTYDFTFTSDNFASDQGPAYLGRVTDDGYYGYQVGQTIAAPGGSYTITGIEASSLTQQVAVGSVQILTYYENMDEYVQQGGSPNGGATPLYSAQGLIDGSSGIGSERDFVQVTTSDPNLQTAIIPIGGAGMLPADAAPVAVADSYATTQGIALTIPAALGLLSNDTDADGDALTAALVTGPAHGALQLQADGSFTYTPDASYIGPDNFTYRASDGTLQSAATSVSLTIKPADRPPVAVNDSYTVPHDAPEISGAVLANDTDPDGDLLSAVLQSNVAHGAFNLAPGGTFEYTPDPGFAGTDTFTYVANDGVLNSNVATVTFNVLADQAPVAVDDSFTIPQGSQDVAGSVLANDTDADGDTLTAILKSNVTHGSLNLVAGGAFDYTPDAGFAGKDTFTYVANDGALNSNIATVTFNVVDQAPVAVDDSVSIPHGVGIVDSVLTNDTDPNGNTLTPTLQTGVSHGSLILEKDGAFEYTPDPTFVGTDTFTYQDSDGQFTSNVATVAINVTDQAPVAVNDSYSTPHGTPLPDVPPLNALANDTDPDGDKLTAVLKSGRPHGEFSLLTNGKVEYSPDPSFVGTDTFTYVASDGALTSNVATITVNVTDQAPVAVNDSFSVAHVVHGAASATGSVLTNDTDADGDRLTAVMKTNVMHGHLDFSNTGDFTYAPDAGFVGTDTFTYLASDGPLTSNVATVTFTSADQAPVAVNDSFSVAHVVHGAASATGSVLTNDTDADGDKLTAVMKTNVMHGHLDFSNTGDFTYAPDAGFVGTDTFTYVASDGILNSNVATVTFTSADQAPVAVNDSYAIPHIVGGIQPFRGLVLSNDTDADGDTLTAVLKSGVAHGTLNFNSDGTFQYDPGPGFTGTDSFTYIASDGVLTSNVATATITYTNQAPVAADKSFSVSGGGTDDISDTVRANDSDPDGDALTATLKAGPAHGSLNLAPGGTFVYVPASGFVGTDKFTYVESDGRLNSNVATVTLNVEDDAPVAVDQNISIPTGVAEASGPVLANASDADGDALTAVVKTKPAHGSFSLTPDGNFLYVPDANYLGTDSVTYVASDGRLTSNVATITFIVGDQAPVAVNDSFTVKHGGVLVTPSVLANDTDADGNSLSAVRLTDVKHGVLNFAANGTIEYMPDAGFVGTDTFTYQATDGVLVGNAATVTINVTDHAPVAVNDSFSISHNTGGAVGIANSVLINDTDADGDPLTATLVRGVAHGTFNLAAGGTFNYTPDPGFVGTDTFTYMANDGALNSNVATVTFTTADKAPVAVNDSSLVAHDVHGAASASGLVLANDTDADGDTLTAVQKSDVTHGTLVFEPGGTFRYTPDAGFVGTDKFTYVASDGLLTSNVATVTITSADQAPVAVNDSFSIPHTVGGIHGIANSVAANDTDADGDTLTTVLKSGVAHGTLNFNSDGTFVYAPGPGFTGTDSFTYVASDGVLTSNVATATITYADKAPVAVNDSFTVSPGSGGIEDSVLANDTDADGDTLSTVVKSNVAHGSLTVSPDGGIFTYLPDAGFTGTDSFTYAASDGVLTSNVATATITVSPNTSPGRPVLTAPLSKSLVAGTVTGISGVSLVETGAGPGESFAVRLIDTHGLLTAAGAGVTGSGTNVLTINGSLAAVNASLATLSDTDLTAGTDKISIVATDSIGRVANGVTIAVTASGTVSNAAPVIVGRGITAVNLTIGAGGSEFLTPGGTANNTTITARGVQGVLPGATTNNTIIQGGVAGVAGIANNTQLGAGGFEVTGFGGNSNATVIHAGGTEYALFNGTATNTIIDAGGTLIIGPGGSIAGGVTFAGSNAVLSLAGATLPTAPISGFDLNGATNDAIILTGFTYEAGHDSAALGAGNFLTLNLNGSIEKLTLNPNENYTGHSFSVTTNSLDQVVIIDPVTGSAPGMDFLAPATAAGSPNMIAQIMGRSAALVQDSFENGPATAAFQPALKNFAAINTQDMAAAGSSLASLNLPPSILLAINKLAAHPA